MAKYDPRYAKEIRLVPDMPTKYIPPELRSVDFSIVWMDRERGQKLVEMDSEKNIRPLDPKQVDGYRRDLVADRFVFNAAPICTFPANGVHGRRNAPQRLGDGNHRANMVAGLDKPDIGYYSMLVSNLSPAAEAVIDIQRKRTMGQKFRSWGEPNPNMMAAVVRWASAWEMLGLRWGLSRSRVSDGEQEEYYRANIDDLQWAVQQGMVAKTYIDVYPSPFAAIMYLTSIFTDRDTATEFWIKGVCEKDSIPLQHPAQQLFKRLKALSKSDKKNDYDSLLSLLITGWNEWVINKDGPWAQFPNMPKGGWTADNMPDLYPIDTRSKYPLPQAEEAKPHDADDDIDWDEEDDI
jgi:hypothetical protein